MSSFLGRLLRGKEPGIEELRSARETASLRRDEARLALKKLLVRRDQALAGIKEARAAGDALKVDAIWDELEAYRSEIVLARREAKVAALESLALHRYVAGMEHLARRGDRDGVRRLFERARTSRLPDLLARAEIDEERYREELGLLIAEAGVEEEREEDPRKEEFLRRLDRIAEAEGAGRTDEARREEDELRQELEDGAV